VMDREPGAYTWWPDGDEAGGLRTDTHIISDLFIDRVSAAKIYDAEAFSRHAPVVIDYNISL